ncbi:hypothetical protein ACN3XK_52655 [Actinomadura welshii]
MSKPSASRTDRRRRPARRERTPLERAGWWAVAAAASYGLMLTVASDTFFWFAIPGFLGLTAVVWVAMSAVLRKVPWNDDVMGLVKRYCLIFVLGAALIAVPWVTDLPHLYPFMGIGMLVLFTGPKILADQKRDAR